MTHIRARSMVAVLGVTLMAAACRIQENPRAQRVDLAEVARQEIAVTVDASRDAILAGDIDALAAAFTPDARLGGDAADDVVGPRGVREAFGATRGGPAIRELSLDRERIDVVEGGTAYEMGTFASTVEDTAGVRAVNGRYAIRWRRGPETQWRVERLLVNRFPAADTATSDTTSSVAWRGDVPVAEDAGQGLRRTDTAYRQATSPVMIHAAAPGFSRLSSAAPPGQAVREQ